MRGLENSVCKIHTNTPLSVPSFSGVSRGESSREPSRERHGLLLDGGHVGRPAERSAAEQHISDESVDGRLADETHEEQLLDDLRGDGAQRRQAQQQLAEARRLRGVLRADVVLERALRLLL